jgi:transposase
VKKSVVNAYLAGMRSSPKIGKKFGVSYVSVSRWVRENESVICENVLYAKAATLPDMDQEDKIKEPDDSDQVAEIPELKKQLEEERLHNKLLTAIIDITEGELKIHIRKKYGARQFKK